MDAEKMGRFIADCRKAIPMTQAELGAVLSVSDKTISRWERGVGFPDVNSIEPLANALGVRVSELIKGQKDEKFDEDEMWKETLQLLEWQRKNARRKCMAALVFAVLSMVIGIATATYYVPNLHIRTIIFCLLTITGVFVSGTLTALYRKS